MKALLSATIAFVAAMAAWVHMHCAPDVSSGEIIPASSTATIAAAPASGTHLAERSQVAAPEPNPSNPAIFEAPNNAPKRTPKVLNTKDDHETRSMLADQEGREQLFILERERAAAERPDVMEALSLSNGEYKRLLDLLAEQSLELKDMIFNSPGLDVHAMENLQAQHLQEIAVQFGEHRASSFKIYEESMIARTFVGQFVRAWLKDDMALTAQQTSALVIAVHETTQHFDQELRSQYQNLPVALSGGTASGAAFMASHSVGRSLQEQVSSQMDDYHERLLRAAAPVLTNDQFDVFTREARYRLEKHKQDLLANHLE
jgi:hypothetical protein